MLSASYLQASVPCGKPLLVFLHGLLGSGEEWQCVTDQLNEFDSLLIDLPGHGASAGISAGNFDHCCHLIAETVKQNRQDDSQPIAMIGYSLGARLAMYGLSFGLFEQLNVVSYLIEGGNFGLRNQEERELRLQNDQHWADCFTQQKIDTVLQNWYQQPVFSSLSPAQRAMLVEKRSHNRGERVADMLLATTLAKQPWLLDLLLDKQQYIHYICGEKDKKFTELAERSGLSYSCIDSAGHNVHQEQPIRFAQLIQQQTDMLCPSDL